MFELVQILLSDDLNLLMIKLYTILFFKCLDLNANNITDNYCSRGKMLLGYTDAELANLGGYDLVHYDDLAYVASAHQECKY